MAVAAILADYHTAWDHLPAPDTALGWATLLFVIALVLTLLTRGIQSLGGTLEDYLGFKNLVFFFFVLAIILFYATA